MCSSSAAEANSDDKGKATAFDKFDDENFFGKFVNEGGLDAEEEAMLESKDYEKDFKRSGKREFVPDEFEKLTQPEITHFYEDQVKDIAFILDPDLEHPDGDDLDVHDLVDEAQKAEFSSLGSDDDTMGSHGTGIDDTPSVLTPSMLRIKQNKVDEAHLVMRSPLRYERSKEADDLVDSMANYFAQQQTFEYRKEANPEKEEVLMDDIFEGVSDATRQPLEALMREVYGDRLLRFAGPMRTPVVEHELPEGHWGIDFIENCRLEMMNNPYYPPEEIERALKVYAHRIRNIETQQEIDAANAMGEEEEEEEEDLDDEEDEVWDAYEEDEEDTV